MIVGVGIDIVKVSRLDSSIKRWGAKFAQRFFSEREIKMFSNRMEEPGLLARQFAAKEAVSKALGTGMKRIGFRDITVTRNEAGAPLVELSGNAATRAAAMGVENIHISMSDERDYAIAYAVAE